MNEKIVTAAASEVVPQILTISISESFKYG